MKSTVLVIVLTVMIASVMSRRAPLFRNSLIGRDAPKESHEKLIKGSYEDPADCKSCFEDCYLPGDEKEQIDACSEECKC